MAKLLVAAIFVASFLLVGCSGGGDTPVPVGEIKTSKAGAEQMKKNGGRGGGAAAPALEQPK